MACYVCDADKSMTWHSWSINYHNTYWV